MAKSDRTVLEPVAEFDPSPTSTTRLSSFQSIALSTSSPSSQTLIFIGTDNGTLILLSLNPSSSSSLPNNITLLRSVKVSDSPIHSIHVLVEIGRVLGLSAGVLFSFDLLLSEPVRRLASLRGATVVARRLRFPDSVFPKDCGDDSTIRSTGQRLLQKLSGAGARVNGVKSRDSSDLQNVDNSHLAVVMGKRLLLVELRFSDLEGFLVSILKEIQDLDGVTTIVWFGNSIIVGSTVNGYVLFSSITGQSIPLFSLPESSGPPRLKSLGSTKEAILVVDNVGIVVNSLGQPVGGSLLFKHPPDSIGETSGHVIVARDGKLDVYHRKTGIHVQSIAFAGQGVFGPCIVASEESGSGELVVVSAGSKAICYRLVSAEEQIKDLLRKKNLREAISLVEELECEGALKKEMISFVHAQVGFLLLFDLHFEDAVNHFLQSETMQPSEIFPFIMRDPNRWSTLVPRNRYWGLHPPPVPLEDVVDNGLMAIQRGIFLRKAGVDTGADEGFLLSPPSRADLLESAIKNIIRYLQVSRNRELSPSVREGVDTLLMYLYRALNLVVDMEQLASSENSCVVEELETLLDDSGHLRTLAFLYASKGMSSNALDIWRLLARNHSPGLWKDSAGGENSHDNYARLLSDQKTAAIEASHLLEESSDQNLVLQHLSWLADVDQELAVRVLTSEKRANQFSPDEVLATIDSKRVEVHQRYLQWLVEDQDSDDTRFHTLYAISLAKSAVEIVEVETHQNSDGSISEGMNNSDVDSSTILLRNSVRERLQLFLQYSDLYDPEAVLDLIGDSELWLEKAILYRKLGQESLVLQILALKLEDSEAAEQYCAEIGRPDAYMQLLDMYLDPQDGKEPMFKAAVRLLHNYGECLDPLLVLESLSPDMPLHLASDTLIRMLRARVHHHRQGQIVHNLSQAINIDAKLARFEERSRHVQINDESLCDSCHARLGTKLFAMYPDDSVVCYKCYRRLGESTSSTGRNFKRDMIFKPGWLVNRQT